MSKVFGIRLSLPGGTRFAFKAPTRFVQLTLGELQLQVRSGSPYTSMIKPRCYTLFVSIQLTLIEASRESIPSMSLMLNLTGA